MSDFEFGAQIGQIFSGLIGGFAAAFITAPILRVIARRTTRLEVPYWRCYGITGAANVSVCWIAALFTEMGWLVKHFALGFVEVGLMYGAYVLIVWKALNDYESVVVSIRKSALLSIGPFLALFGALLGLVLLFASPF